MKPETINLLLPEDSITLVLTLFLAVLIVILAEKVKQFYLLKKKIGYMKNFNENFLNQADRILSDYMTCVKIVISLSPLLGILGTIYGIQLSLLGAASNDLTIRMAGVGQALNTTAAGILVSCFGLLIVFIVNSLRRKIHFLIN